MSRTNNQKQKPQMVQNPLGREYDNAEFSVSGSTTNYNVKANEADTFNNCDKYTTLWIQSDVDIKIRLNANTNPLISVEGSSTWGRGVILDNLLEIVDLFITTISAANVRIFGVDKGGE